VIYEAIGDRLIEHVRALLLACRSLRTLLCCLFAGKAATHTPLSLLEVARESMKWTFARENIHLPRFRRT
jgi:hypothetical protein